MQFIKNDNAPFILTFDIPTIEPIAKLFSLGVDCTCSISNDISIIVANEKFDCELSKNCSKYSNIFNYCDFENIHIALRNAKKLQKEYSLIILSPDALAVRDLDEQMIETFKSFDTPFVFSGMEMPFVEDDFSNLKTLSINGPCKYLSAGAIFGYTDKLYEFFMEFKEFYKKNIDVLFHDIPVRIIDQSAALELFINLYNKVDISKSVDANSKLFGTINVNEHRLTEVNNKRYITPEGLYYMMGGII